MINAHIPLYKFAGDRPNYEPTRSRKLLLKKKEIAHLVGKVNEKGLTLVPVSIYITRGKAKLKLAVGRGKKTFDKRAQIKEREEKRKLSRLLKSK